MYLVTDLRQHPMGSGAPPI